MSGNPKTAEVITLLANDALEATENQHAVAATMLMDAALSILVTRHRGEAARRELAAMFSEYVVQQVEAVIRSEHAA